VERQAQVALHLLLFLQTCALGKCTGNFATNLFAGLSANNLLTKKPEMNIEIIDRS